MTILLVVPAFSFVPLGLAPHTKRQTDASLGACHAYGLRAAAPRMAPSYGLSDREVKRLSLMKRPCEPLDEEIEGLCILTGLSGVLFGRSLFGSTVVGGILGAQVGTLLAFGEDAAADKLRAAGWVASSRCRAVLRRVRNEGERRGVTRRLRRLQQEVLAFDEHTGLSARVVADVRHVSSWMSFQVRRTLFVLGAWSRRAGLTQQARRLWKKTGIPKAVAESRARATLNARMASLRRSAGSSGSADDGTLDDDSGPFRP